MSKKRAFVRYSKNGKIVPGSLVLTSGSFPSGPSTWTEVPADLCCDTTITFTLADPAITNLSLRFYCNGVLIGNPLETHVNTTTYAEVLAALNESFSGIGTWSNVGSEFTLVLNPGQKLALCGGSLEMLLAPEILPTTTTSTTSTSTTTSSTTVTTSSTTTTTTTP